MSLNYTLKNRQGVIARAHKPSGKEAGKNSLGHIEDQIEQQGDPVSQKRERERECRSMGDESSCSREGMNLLAAEENLAW